jgi:Coenzyme PQQ synthesis protein D (PqqD)
MNRSDDRLSRQELSLRPSADVIARRLDRAGVLVHLTTNRIFELNETGIRIWELLSEQKDVDRIIEHLVDEFDVDGQRAARDVEGLLLRFRHEGLVGS